MPNLVLESVTKVFRHRPSLLNLLGKERGGETVALDQVSLEGAEGEVLVLLGPNGSGKTTLLKLVATMLTPDSGRVLVGGMDTIQHAPRIRQLIGFAVANEKSFYPRLTARENLAFFATLEDIPSHENSPRVDELLLATGLAGAQDTLVMKFSSGMYQKLGLARALLKNPSVLLLDEPSRSLAPEAVDSFGSLLKSFTSKGTTILLATHNFEEAATVGDQVAVMRSGRLVLQRGVNHMSREELRSLYFRTVATSGPSVGAHLG